MYRKLTRGHNELYNARDRLLGAHAGAASTSVSLSDTTEMDEGFVCHLRYVADIADVQENHAHYLKLLWTSKQHELAQQVGSDPAVRRVWLQ